MSGPLSGLTVIELAGLGPAPFCGMILADLGAQVTRVDRMRPAGTGAVREKDFLGRGRRSIIVDLKHPEGPGVVRELAASADVLLEGFRPGVMERLGLGPQDLLAAVPTLIYGRMTGWGQSGPLAPAAGHDINYIAVAGALEPVGRPAARRYRRLPWSATSAAAGCCSPWGYARRWSSAQSQGRARSSMPPRWTVPRCS